MSENEKYAEYLKSDKWHEIAMQRLKIDDYKCVVCGTCGSENNALEVHHLSYKYLYAEENRIYQDLVTLCHRDHKRIHACMNRITSPDGRRGWKDNSKIPKLVFIDPSEQEEPECLEVIRRD